MFFFYKKLYCLFNVYRFCAKPKMQIREGIKIIKKHIIRGREREKSDEKGRGERQSDRDRDRNRERERDKETKSSREREIGKR